MFQMSTFPESEKWSEFKVEDSIHIIIFIKDKIWKTFKLNTWEVDCSEENWSFFCIWPIISSTLSHPPSSSARSAILQFLSFLVILWKLLTTLFSDLINHFFHMKFCHRAFKCTSVKDATTFIYSLIWYLSP